MANQLNWMPVRCPVTYGVFVNPCRLLWWSPPQVGRGQGSVIIARRQRKDRKSMGFICRHSSPTWLLLCLCSQPNPSSTLCSADDVAARSCCCISLNNVFRFPYTTTTVMSLVQFIHLHFRVPLLSLIAGHPTTIRSSIKAVTGMSLFIIMFIMMVRGGDAELRTRKWFLFTRWSYY